MANSKTSMAGFGIDCDIASGMTGRNRIGEGKALSGWE